MEKLYPFLFEPNLHAIVWGGKRLCPYKGLPLDDAPIGESWEVSAVPSSTSVISNGAFAGKLLTDVLSRFPEAILGDALNVMGEKAFYITARCSRISRRRRIYCAASAAR